MSHYRSLSPMECTYLATDREDASYMVNQFVVEGLGELSLMEWKEAVEAAAEANPGIKLSLKGRWGFRYWDEAGKYPLVEKGQSAWSGDSDEGAVFHGRSINCRKGPCAEICLLESEYPKIVFRTHHALADGNSTLHWVQEVFRALRGDALLGSAGRKTESDIRKAFSVSEAEVNDHQWLPVLDNAGQVDLAGCYWQTFRCSGDMDRVLSTLIKCLSDRAFVNNKTGKVIFRIPTNLRRLLDADESYNLGNMVGALDLQLSQDDDEAKIYKHILSAIYKKQDLAIFPKNIGVANWLPGSVFEQSPKYYNQLHREGRCDITGIIAHVGKVALSDFSYQDFRATGIYAIPVPLDGVSISCVLVVDEKGLNACISVPKALANRQQLRDLSEQLKTALS